MCGVLLILSKKRTLNKKKCYLGFDAIKNRGPDLSVSKYFLNNKLFIGNTVLQVTGKVDKKKLSTCEDERFYISFNGEIYNYKDLKKLNKFSISASNDTSKIIKLHKYNSPINILKSIEGMFAYAVYDNQNKKLYYATDTQGEKKLFSYEDKNYFILSSNIHAIMKFFNINFKINRQQIFDYLNSRHFLTDNNTFYKKINLLDGGFLYSKDLTTYKSKKLNFENPLNWIDEKYYRKLKSNKEIQNLNLLDNLFKKYSKLLKPTINFASIFTGGVDSSLQASYFFKEKKLKKLICVDHIKKDLITNKIVKFKEYTGKNITKILCDEKIYYSKLSEVYKRLYLPLPSHDVVGHHLVYKFFKSKKIKVSFGASGADELFGGYEAYKKINWNCNKIKNLSPYSNFKIKKSNKNSKISKVSNLLWKKAFNKYSKFLNNTEAKMQASLFTDYFIQGIRRDNIVTDIISMSHGVEVRNVFLNKNIIKFCLNLPIKYKINLKEKNELMVCKPILKKLFIRKFNRNLLFKKQGFSGFPNESIKYSSKKNQKEFNNISKLIFKKSQFTNFRENEWKFLNLFYFSKFLGRKINIRKFINNI